MSGDDESIQQNRKSAMGNRQLSSVRVDPACNINYCSFYIQGLYDVFGIRNVKFTSEGFEDLRYTCETHYLAFIIDDRRYVIDCADSNALYAECFLKWADVYGKVNYNASYLPKAYKHKIKRVGPNFGIPSFGKNKYEALLWCLRNYIKVYKRLDYKFGAFLSPYLWLYKRYGQKMGPNKSNVGSRTIFMVSRYWEGQTWANEARVNFIRACRRLEREGRIKFIGGMVPDQTESACPVDVLLKEEIPFKEYHEGLEQSLIAFNTPAYHKCHGWKLPEYLSQGKIILSTPFINELPISLLHEENIYISESDEESLYNSISIILEDQELQVKLEKGSREYWEKYASPQASIFHFFS